MSFVSGNVATPDASDGEHWGDARIGYALKYPAGRTSPHGGEGGIRTHGTVARTTVFETVPIDLSGTSPQRGRVEGGALLTHPTALAKRGLREKDATLNCRHDSLS